MYRRVSKSNQDDFSPYMCSSCSQPDVNGICENPSSLVFLGNELMQQEDYATPSVNLITSRSREGPCSSGWSPGAPSVATAHVHTTELIDNVQRPVEPEQQGRLSSSNMNQKRHQQSLKEKRCLVIRRTRACDFSLALAVFGIVVIVLEAELTEAQHIEKDSVPSVMIQCLALLSTLVLLYQIAYYHFMELKITGIDSGTQDWRVGLTWQRILQLTTELCVCAMCPLPGGMCVHWTILRNPRYADSALVRLDALMSIPMFLRFYLVCRFIVLHSRQFQDAATRSIASLNYITMNFQFVFRTLVDENPLLVMVVFSLSFCLLMAWILTQCDRYSGAPSNRYYANALWFIVVTYISIGYGDVVPLSYCARALAIFTGIVGKVVSSVLIAVISRKMQLTSGEIHVHNFVSDSKLAKARKNAASRVLQNIWLIHRYKKKGNTDDRKLRQHQRKFLDATSEFRRVKWEQRLLAETSNSFVNMSVAQMEMSRTVWGLQRSQLVLSSQITFLTDRMQELTTMADKSRRISNARAAAVDQKLKVKLATIESTEQETKGVTDTGIIL